MKVMLTRIWLIFVAAYPIIAVLAQIAGFMFWLLDMNAPRYIGIILGSYSPLFLAISFIVSIRERFCVFHRLCILSVFLVNINHLWAMSMSPIVANHITIVIVLAALTGIIGALIHFSFQIKDFIKYARIQSKKQDSYQRAL